MRALLAALLLAGCASGPARHTYYERQPWAKEGFEQAKAECYYEINQPGKMGSLYLCLESKGWHEVH